jgi:hypothetical protein
MLDGFHAMIKSAMDETSNQHPALDHRQVIRFFRKSIPSFVCEPGCHDCCGPVTASSEEVSRLPQQTEAAHVEALANYNCVYLGVNGCQVYEERPLICRLFGTTPRLVCPKGKAPAVMIDAKIEADIHRFMAETRQVLL